MRNITAETLSQAFELVSSVLSEAERRRFVEAAMALTGAVAFPVPPGQRAELQHSHLPPTLSAVEDALERNRSGREHPQWEDWLKRGRMASARIDPLNARDCYALAARTAPNEVTEALATAKLAEANRDLNDMLEAEQLTNHALSLLKLNDISPDTGPSYQVIETRCTDERALETLGHIASVQGYLWRTYETSSTWNYAKAAYTTLLYIGRLRQDNSMVATAEHFLGQLNIEAGTSVDDTDPRWRVVRYPRLVWEGITLLRTARGHRPINDDGGRAEDWRQEVRAQHLLEPTGDGNVAQQAIDLFGDSPAIVSWWKDVGQWAVVDGRDDKAEAFLRETTYAAKEIHSPLLISLALIGLAQLKAILQKSPEALAYAIAALIAWPMPFSGRDFARTARLLADICEPIDFESRTDVHRYLDRIDYPFDVISQLPNFSDIHATELNDYLRRGILRR